jgi:molybdopterin synthase catalytic subunit
MWNCEITYPAKFGGMIDANRSLNSTLHRINRSASTRSYTPIICRMTFRGRVRKIVGGEKRFSHVTLEIESGMIRATLPKQIAKAVGRLISYGG